MPSNLKTASGQIISTMDPNYDEYLRSGATPVQDMTQAPTTPVAPPNLITPPTIDPTASNVYSGFQTQEEKDLQAEQDRQTEQHRLQSQEVPLTQAETEAKIRAGFQSEIDALNRVYAVKNAEAKQAGMGRMGSSYALQAASGSANSNFGTAETEQMKGYNQDIINALEAERSAKESNIMAVIKSNAAAEMEKRRLAIEGGAAAYLADKTAAVERKRKTIKDVLKNVLTTKTQMNEALAQQIADGLKISKEDFMSEYNKEKAAYDQSLIKENITLNAGQSIYNPNTGKLEYTAPTEADKPVVLKPGETLFNPRTGAKIAGLPGEAPKPMSMQPGEVLVDANGKVVFTAPEKPINPTDNTRVVGDNLLQYDPATNSWNTIYSSNKTTKPELVDIEGKKYERIVGANGEITYTEPKLPVNQGAIDLNNADVTTTINGIKALANHQALDSSVGPNKLSRIALTDSFGPQADFIAGVEQLINQQTLDTLVNLKKAGGTLGALSDSERAMLQSAASRINQWRVRENNDPNGKVVGYEVSESLFKTELKRLTDLAAKAYQASSPSAGTKTIQDYQREFPQATPQELQQLMQEESGKTNVDSDTNKAVIQKATSKTDGTKGGQCGAFVNKLTGLGLGDSYQSKMSKMDPSITVPVPGMAFVMPLKGEFEKYGHTGIITKVNNDGTVTVKDSNWSKDEKIKTHDIPLNKITGLARV